MGGQVVGSPWTAFATERAGACGADASGTSEVPAPCKQPAATTATSAKLRDSGVARIPSTSVARRRRPLGCEYGRRAPRERQPTGLPLLQQRRQHPVVVRLP